DRGLAEPEQRIGGELLPIEGHCDPTAHIAVREKLMLGIELPAVCRVERRDEDRAGRALLELLLARGRRIVRAIDLVVNERQHEALRISNHAVRYALDRRLAFLEVVLVPEHHEVSSGRPRFEDKRTCADGTLEPRVRAEV